MYYTIQTVPTGWGVYYGGERLATFGSYVEARAYIKGRRSREERQSMHKVMVCNGTESWVAKTFRKWRAAVRYAEQLRRAKPHWNVWLEAQSIAERAMIAAQNRQSAAQTG